MKNTIQFSWRPEFLTTQLVQDVGSIVLTWAWIDHEISRMCQMFWLKEHPEERLPQSFDTRANILKIFAKALYVPREPAEYRIFVWFIQRIKAANGKRDDLAHGIHGLITKNGRTREGLLVPHPSRKTDYIPMTAAQIGKFNEELSTLNREVKWVGLAFSQAVQATSPHKSFGLIDGVWTQDTWDNRSPKLPQLIPPPPTFRE